MTNRIITEIETIEKEITAWFEKHLGGDHAKKQELVDSIVAASSPVVEGIPSTATTEAAPAAETGQAVS